MKAAFLLALALPSPLKAVNEHVGEETCYCKNSGGDLASSIADVETKVSELPSAVERAEGQLRQLKEYLKKALTDRAAAKAAIAEATAVREKEASELAALSSEFKIDIGAIGKAVAALEKGMGGAFLQTAAASVLTNLVENDQKMLDVDREELTAFLSCSTMTMFRSSSRRLPQAPAPASCNCRSALPFRPCCLCTPQAAPPVL